MHMQLPAVRFGQLSERFAVPGLSPGDQAGSYQIHGRVTFFPQPVELPCCTDTG